MKKRRYRPVVDKLFRQGATNHCIISTSLPHKSGLWDWKPKCYAPAPPEKFWLRLHSPGYGRARTTFRRFCSFSTLLAVCRPHLLLNHKFSPYNIQGYYYWYHGTERNNVTSQYRDHDVVFERPRVNRFRSVTCSACDASDHWRNGTIEALKWRCIGICTRNTIARSLLSKQSACLAREDGFYMKRFQLRSFIKICKK